MKLSFSSINNYLMCPKKFYEVNVIYAWRDASFAAAAGTDVHGKIEKYIKGESDSLDIPKDDRVIKEMDNLRYCYKVQNQSVIKVDVERSFALDSNFKPVDYKDPNAILRGKADVCLYSTDPEQGFHIIDWKSGKKRNNALQAHIYGLLIKPFAPHKYFTCRFDYLEKGMGDKYQLTDKGLDMAKQLVETVLSAKSFPERRNPLCAWCPVKSCSYWREKGNEK